MQLEQLALVLAFALGVLLTLFYVIVLLLVRERRDRVHTRRHSARLDITNAPPGWRKRLKAWERRQRTT